MIMIEAGKILLKYQFFYLFVCNRRWQDPSALLVKDPIDAGSPDNIQF